MVSNTIGIIDDNEDFLDSLIMLLSKNRFRIIFKALNGNQGIEKYKSLDELPKIILMDFRMPFINGLETAKEIQKINPTQLFIFISADDELNQDLLNNGFDYYVHKPFRIQFLLKKIKTIIENEK